MRVREVGDPWWTLFTHMPRHQWWAPAVIAAPCALLVDHYVLGSGWLESALKVGLICAVLLAMVWGGVVRAEPSLRSDRSGSQPEDRDRASAWAPTEREEP